MGLSSKEIENAAYKWLNDNLTMYDGHNASRCQIAAFIAGAKMFQPKCPICKKEMSLVCENNFCAPHDPDLDCELGGGQFLDRTEGR